MDKDLKFKWLEVIVNKEGVLVSRRSWLEAKFWALIGFAGILSNGIIKLCKNEFHLKSSDYCLEELIACSMMVLVLYWLDAPRGTIGRFYKEEHTDGINNYAAWSDNKVPDFLILWCVATVQGFLLYFLSYFKVNSWILIFPITVSVIIACLQTFAILIPSCNKWWYQNGLKRAWIMKNEEQLNLAVVSFCLLAVGLLGSIGIYLMVIWMVNPIFILELLIAFSLLVWVLSEAYVTYVGSSHLPDLHKLHLSLSIDHIKTESELKQEYEKIMSKV